MDSVKLESLASDLKQLSYAMEEHDDYLATVLMDSSVVVLTCALEKLAEESFRSSVESLPDWLPCCTEKQSLLVTSIAAHYSRFGEVSRRQMELMKSIHDSTEGKT